MTRSFQRNSAQALNTDYLYTYWKWRVLRMALPSRESPTLGYAGRCADDLQLADKLQSIDGDVADLLGYQRLCERRVLSLEHPPDHLVVAATGTRTRLRYLGHLRRLGNADQVANHWLDGGDIRLARRLPILSGNGCGVGGDCFYCSHEFAAGDGADDSGRLHADQGSKHGFKDKIWPGARSSVWPRGFSMPMHTNTTAYKHR